MNVEHTRRTCGGPGLHITHFWQEMYVHTLEERHCAQPLRLCAAACCEQVVPVLLDKTSLSTLHAFVWCCDVAADCLIVPTSTDLYVVLLW